MNGSVSSPAQDLQIAVPLVAALLDPFDHPPRLFHEIYTSLPDDLRHRARAALAVLIAVVIDNPADPKAIDEARELARYADTPEMEYSCAIGVRYGRLRRVASSVEHLDRLAGVNVRRDGAERIALALARCASAALARRAYRENVTDEEILQEIALRAEADSA